MMKFRSIHLWRLCLWLALVLSVVGCAEQQSNRYADKAAVMAAQPTRYTLQQLDEAGRTIFLTEESWLGGSAEFTQLTFWRETNGQSEQLTEILLDNWCGNSIAWQLLDDGVLLPATPAGERKDPENPDKCKAQPARFYRLHGNEIRLEQGEMSTPLADYLPGDPYNCQAMRDLVAQALRVEAILADQPAALPNLPTGESGQSCQVVATGTGVEFTNVGTITNTLLAQLTSQGWERDPADQANDPTGVLVGLRQGRQRVVFTVEWTPALGVTCPQAAPVATCAEQLEPEQILYTIKLHLAQQTQLTDDAAAGNAPGREPKLSPHAG